MNLKTYIEILENCSVGEVLSPDRDDSDPRYIAMRLLHADGLLHFDEYERFSPVSITPKGSMALIEWEEFINKRTLKHKLVSGISKLFWILVGALLASLKEIVQWLNT